MWNGERKGGNAMAPTTVPLCCLDFCEKPGGKICSACKEARYCCAEHQREAWPIHKSACKAAVAARQACSTLLAELESDNVAALGAACDRLSQLLASGDRNGERLMAMGAFDAIVRAAAASVEGDVTEMGLLQAKLLAAFYNVCFASSPPADDTRRDKATASGAIGMAVAALRAHPGEARVVAVACQLLRKTVDGDAEEGVEQRCEAATSCGAIEAVVAGMCATRRVPAPTAELAATIAREACAALCILTFGLDNCAAEARSQQAAQGGAIEEVVHAMTTHVASESVQAQACSALANICAGFDEAAQARRQLAMQAGAIAAIEAAGDADGRGKLALDVLRTDGLPQ